VCQKKWRGKKIESQKGLTTEAAQQRQINTVERLGKNTFRS